MQHLQYWLKAALRIPKLQYPQCIIQSATQFYIVTSCCRRWHNCKNTMFRWVLDVSIVPNSSWADDNLWLNSGDTQAIVCKVVRNSTAQRRSFWPLLRSCCVRDWHGFHLGEVSHPGKHPSENEYQRIITLDIEFFFFCALFQMLFSN